MRKSTKKTKNRNKNSFFSLKGSDLMTRLIKFNTNL